MLTVLPPSIPLVGQSLRYRLSLEIRQAGELTVAELVRRLAADGCTLEGRPSKVISDALRWEAAHGRVIRVARGRYRTGRIPRSTRWWMLRTLQRWATAHHNLRDRPTTMELPESPDPVPLDPEPWAPIPTRRPPSNRPSGLVLYRRHLRTRRPWERSWPPGWLTSRPPSPTI